MPACSKLPTLLTPRPSSAVLPAACSAWVARTFCKPTGAATAKHQAGASRPAAAHRCPRDGGAAQNHTNANVGVGLCATQLVRRGHSGDPLIRHLRFVARVVAGAPELEDVQDECAWRMGQWATVSGDEGQHTADDAGEGGRFNYAVLHTLRALAVGDHVGCQDLLTSARRVCPACCACTVCLLECSASCVRFKQFAQEAHSSWTCKSAPCQAHVFIRPCLDTAT